MITRMKLVVLLVVGISAWVSIPGTTSAQTYPTKPIKVIVPYAPGGSGDITARLLSDRLRPKLGQPLIVENKPGANGSIGTDFVAKAAPDGYTLALVVASHAFAKALMPDLPFDPVLNFAPVSMTTRTHVVLVTAPSFPPNTVSELIAYVRARPNQFAFASAGTGSNVHLFGEWFNMLAGIKATHVPYKGSAAAHPDLISGRTQWVFDTYASVRPHVEAKRLKLIAVCGEKRLPQLPNIPTVSESGLPEFKAYSWTGILAPANTPKPIIDRLNREILSVLQADELRERLVTIGADPVGSSPEEFRTAIEAEDVRFGKLIRSLNIRLE